MTKLMSVVFTGLFVMSVGSGSFAGVLDDLKNQADEAKQEASDTMKQAKEEPGKAIEAQDASNKEGGDMMEQAKDVVKETVNEQIDRVGK